MLFQTIIFADNTHSKRQISKKQLMSVSLRVTDVKNDSAKRISTKLVANMIKSVYLFSKFTTFCLPNHEDVVYKLSRTIYRR